MHRIRHVESLGATWIFFGCLLCVQGDNLLVSGSFEEGPDLTARASAPVSPGSTEITGWVVTRGGIDYTGGEWEAADGVRSIDLEGSPGFGGIRQTFDTTPDQLYTVTFSLAGNPCDFMNPPEIKKVRVAAAADFEDFSFNVRGRSATDMGWTTKTWSFRAKDTATTIELYSTGTGPGWCGPAIDNVVVAEAGAEFVRGDVNADSSLNIVDPVLILNHLFGRKIPPCLDAADSDDNGALEITDAVYLLNSLFLGGPAPAQPFPSCGLDSTTDELTCASFDACEEP